MNKGLISECKKLPSTESFFAIYMIVTPNCSLKFIYFKDGSKELSKMRVEVKSLYFACKGDSPQCTRLTTFR
jgi:hypothetical protein